MHVQAAGPAPGAERDLEQVDVFQVMLTVLISEPVDPVDPPATVWREG